MLGPVCTDRYYAAPLRLMLFRYDCDPLLRRSCAGIPGGQCVQGRQFYESYCDKRLCRYMATLLLALIMVLDLAGGVGLVLSGCFRCRI